MTCRNQPIAKIKSWGCKNDECNDVDKGFVFALRMQWLQLT